MKQIYHLIIRQRTLCIQPWMLFILLLLIFCCNNTSVPELNVVKGRVYQDTGTKGELHYKVTILKEHDISSIINKEYSSYDDAIHSLMEFRYACFTAIRNTDPQGFYCFEHIASGTVFILAEKEVFPIIPDSIFSRMIEGTISGEKGTFVYDLRLKHVGVIKTDIFWRIIYLKELNRYFTRDPLDKIPEGLYSIYVFSDKRFVRAYYPDGKVPISPDTAIRLNAISADSIVAVKEK